MTIDPSTVPGQQSNVDPTTNPPANVANPGLNVSQGTSTIEELQQQLASERAKNAKFEDEAFKAREKERKRKEQELADKADLELKLKEQGEFKTLADNLAAEKEGLQQEIAARDAEIAKRDHEALCLKVATAHGLSSELAARLTGQTEDELNADAALLKKSIDGQAQQALSKQLGNLPGPPQKEATSAQRQEQMIKKIGVNYSKF